jgi:organic radical activating enzyme
MVNILYDIKTTENDYINMIVTHECNRNCPFCVDKYRGNKGYISSESVENALRFAKQYGAKDVLLVGGEPTLHPNIVSIAERVKNYDLNCILTTNYTCPDVVKRLDGVVDSFNISYYGQENLPDQSDFSSDITLSTLIWKGRFRSIDEFDRFIDKYENRFHLKFSTLDACNEWCKKNQKVDFLDYLPFSKDVVLFENNLGHIYRGHVIGRSDVLLNSAGDCSWKCHVNGEITQNWEIN